MTLGRYRDALDALDRAEQGFKAAGQVEAAGYVVAHIGLVHGYRATPEEALPRVQETIRAFECDGPSKTLAALYGALHVLLQASGRFDEQLSAATRAADVARAGGDDKNLVRAGRGRGTALMALGRLEEAREALEATVSLAEATTDAYVLGSVVDTLAQAHLAMGELDASRACWERAARIAAQTGDRVDLVFGLSGLGLASFYLGDWRDARAKMEQAAEAMAEVGSSWVAHFIDLNRAQLALAEGDWKRLRRCVEKVLADADEKRDLRWLARAHSLQAKHDLLAGDAPSALRRLDPFLAIEGPATPWVLVTAAWSRLAMGDVGQAVRLAGRAIAAARAFDRVALAESLRVRGVALARQGCMEHAACVLGQSVDLARRMRYLHGEARALQTLALVQDKANERRRSPERLRAATAILESLGVSSTVTSAETELLRRCLGRECVARVVDDERWARIQAILPPPARTGRRRADDRLTLEAILYVQRTGCAWAELPAELGDDATAHRRLRRWQADGTWARIAGLL